MVRPAVLIGLALCLLPSAAAAGKASAQFKVGITIGGPERPIKTYTWGAATVTVKRAGYGNPKRIALSDGVYWFEADRGGSSFRIAVSIASGEIVEVIPA